MPLRAECGRQLPEFFPVRAGTGLILLRTCCMQPTSRLFALAFSALLFGGIAIGFAGIMMRLSDVNPIASAFWRCALAAPLLWAWALASAGSDRQRGAATE